jgi:hypothetical protein
MGEILFKRNNNFDWNDIKYHPVVYLLGVDGNPNTIEVGIGWETKSLLKAGNMVIHNSKRFNWLQRKMWKLFSGFEIENVKENG